MVTVKNLLKNGARIGISITATKLRLKFIIGVALVALTIGYVLGVASGYFIWG